jgi:hypothetical protein
MKKKIYYFFKTFLKKVSEKKNQCKTFVFVKSEEMSKKMEKNVSLRFVTNSVKINVSN